METKVIEKQRCKRCNFEWWPRKNPEDIKVCPQCKSKSWRVERTDKKGLQNGMEDSVWTKRNEKLKELEKENL